MRRWIATVVAVLGLVAVTTAPALGAPSNGAKAEVLPVTCNGTAGFVLVGAGGPAWGTDAAGNLNGTMYLVKSIDVRGYAGSLTTEPTTAPIFEFDKTYGQKAGLGATIHCTFREVETGPDGTVTVFGDAWVVQVR